MAEIFVAVIGASHCSAEEAANAEAVGRELAKRRAVVVWAESWRQPVAGRWLRAG